MAESISYFKLEKKLANPEPVLKGIGGAMLAETGKAFEAHQLGSFRWPVRYPNQSGMFANIAGIVSDLAKGGNPKDRRFTDRENVLTDTGNVKRSISFALVGKNAVELGTTVPYASVHQFGGETEQAITPTMKEKLADFLAPPVMTGAGAKRRKKTSIGHLYWRRLNFLFDLDVLVTKVNARPFLGITPDLSRQIVGIVEKGFGGAAKAGA